MRVLVLGGDGYLGWPTCMHFAALGHEVLCVDNYLRRTLSDESDNTPLFGTPEMPQRVELFQSLTGKAIRFIEGDLTDFELVRSVFEDFRPETVIHYAEQPSAPYSMAGYDQARLTLDNNLQVTFNCIWAVKDIVPDCHIIKLGTMGEYGTPDIDIEEGWIDINHKGRSDRFLFPRAASSLYHTTKVLDTDLLWFYVRTHGIAVTDLMQGPVYGFLTPETRLSDKLLPFFNYDDVFGTVLNRFMVQAVQGIPLTVYGAGGQTRGYLNMTDTLQCIELAANNPARPGELRILNQFTETFSVSQLAEMVAEAGGEMGLDVVINNIENPRKEKEEHYYNPARTGFTELGLKPTLLSNSILVSFMKKIADHQESIEVEQIMPRVRWSS